MADDGKLPKLEDDGFYLPTIKPHSLEKIRLHNYNTSIFSTAMKNKWPQRAYLGLYSGAGRARVENTGEIIETSALSALRLKDPFTKYIFVDQDPRCIEALGARIAALPGEFDVELLQSDVQSAVPKIINAMPAFRKGNPLLSFCFIDPFSAELDFEVIKVLGTRFIMDFMIVLMIGRDIRANFGRYLTDLEDTRIARLIDDPNWREEWRERGGSPRQLVTFIHEKFDQAMQRIGYQSLRVDEVHPVRISAFKRVYLFSIVHYSKNPLGLAFWRETRQQTRSQLELGF